MHYLFCWDNLKTLYLLPDGTTQQPIRKFAVIKGRSVIVSRIARWEQSIMVHFYMATNWLVTKFSCPAHINLPIFGNANIASKPIMIYQHEWFDAKIWHANIWQNAKCWLVIGWLPTFLLNLTKSCQHLANFDFAKCWLAKYWQCQLLASNQLCSNTYSPIW